MVVDKGERHPGVGGVGAENSSPAGEGGKGVSSRLAFCFLATGGRRPEQPSCRMGWNSGGMGDGYVQFRKVSQQFHTGVRNQNVH